MKEQIVWKKKYKNGVEVVVVRTADYRGTFSINNKAGKSIFSTEVDLTFVAVSGNEAFDNAVCKELFIRLGDDDK